MDESTEDIPSLDLGEEVGLKRRRAVRDCQLEPSVWALGVVMLCVEAKDAIGLASVTGPLLPLGLIGSFPRRGWVVAAAVVLVLLTITASIATSFWTDAFGTPSGPRSGSACMRARALPGFES